MIKPNGFDGRKAGAEFALKEELAASKRPVVLSSFGKDSLCLLALLDEMEAPVEVAHFELGVMPKAHRFARLMIARSVRPVTLLRPHKTLIVAGAAGADVAYEFKLSCGDTFQIVGATFDQSASPQVACGLSADLVKEGRHDPYGWDLIISGRRSCEFDPTVGSLAIAEKTAALPGGARILMPLVEWSDEDVAYFLATRPRWTADADRYFVTSGTLQNRTDKTYNPDWAPICVRCLSAREGEAISCPRALAAASADHRVGRVIDFLEGTVPATVMF